MNILETHRQRVSRERTLEDLAWKAISMTEGFFSFSGLKKFEEAANVAGIGIPRALQRAVSLMNRGTSIRSAISLEAAGIAFQITKKRNSLLESGEKEAKVHKTLARELDELTEKHTNRERLREDIIVALGVLSHDNPPI